MTTSQTNLVLFQEENVQQIIQMGPSALSENTVSHDRCLQAGQALFDRIQREGMTDQLDAEVANFIIKAKKTVKKMNDKRTPLTQLFDRIRNTFTLMEGEVNPSTKDSLPFRLQQCRDQYAAAKHAQALRRQQEEAARQAHLQAVEQFRLQLEQDYGNQFNAYLTRDINQLTATFEAVTLDNYESSFRIIRNTLVELPKDWIAKLRSTLQVPAGITLDECKALAAQVKEKISDRFFQQYASEMADYQADLLDRLPSKRTELERIAAANAQEAARLQAELQEKERQEAASKEAERVEAEQRAKAEAELATKKQEMDALFTHAQTAMPIDNTGVQVKKRMEILNPEGFMDILGLWWSQVGCTLTVEELSKMFSRQVTFCNRQANDKKNPMLIQSEHISYVDDVKAK